MKLKPQLIFFLIGIILLTSTISYFLSGEGSATINPGWNTVVYTPFSVFALKILPIICSFIIAIIYQITLKRGLQINLGITIIHAIFSLPYLFADLFKLPIVKSPKPFVPKF